MAEWLSARGGFAHWRKGVVKKYFVYIIKSKKYGRTYTGYTSDLTGRLKRHNQGRVFSTKAYVPYELIYFEVFQDKTEARKREIFFKSGFGRKLVKEITRRDGRVA